MMTCNCLGGLTYLPLLCEVPQTLAYLQGKYAHLGGASHIFCAPVNHCPGCTLAATLWHAEHVSFTPLVLKKHSPAVLVWVSHKGPSSGLQGLQHGASRWCNTARLLYRRCTASTNKTACPQAVHTTCQLQETLKSLKGSPTQKLLCSAMLPWQ